jgi:hypothetical protein
MKCFIHETADAVALCKHCGKALCADCAQTSQAGTQVCSSQCAASRQGRPLKVSSSFLHCLGAVLTGAAIFYLVQELWQISVFLIFAAFFCFRAGVHAGRKTLGLADLYYRTGDAMEKTHRFREKLQEFTTLYARISGNDISSVVFGQNDISRKVEAITRAFEEIRKKMGSDLAYFEMRNALTRDLQFSQSLAETLFVEHAESLKSLSGPTRVSGKIYSAHLSVRDRIRWLTDVNRQLTSWLKEIDKT